ncbi:MAG: hypothetical protein NTW94_05325 [Legionellales bacterium]|nr:hypothetical protein [Legionellales bacterium]
MIQFTHAAVTLKIDIQAIHGGHRFHSNDEWLAHPETYPSYSANISQAIWNIADKLEEASKKNYFASQLFLGKQYFALSRWFDYLEPGTGTPRIEDELAFHIGLAFQKFLVVILENPAAKKMLGVIGSSRIKDIYHLLNRRLTDFQEHLRTHVQVSTQAESVTEDPIRDPMPNPPDESEPITVLLIDASNSHELDLESSADVIQQEPQVMDLPSFRVLDTSESTMVMVDVSPALTPIEERAFDKPTEVKDAHLHHPDVHPEACFEMVMEVCELMTEPSASREPYLMSEGSHVSQKDIRSAAYSKSEPPFVVPAKDKILPIMRAHSEARVEHCLPRKDMVCPIAPRDAAPTLIMHQAQVSEPALKKRSDPQPDKQYLCHLQTVENKAPPILKLSLPVHVLSRKTQTRNDFFYPSHPLSQLGLKYFDLNQSLIGGVFGNYLRERAMTFWFRDLCSQWAALVFSYVGYRPEALARTEYLQKLRNTFVHYQKHALMYSDLEQVIEEGLVSFNPRQRTGVAYTKSLHATLIGFREELKMTHLQHHNHHEERTNECG